jgi:hypothetical protein
VGVLKDKKAYYWQKRKKIYKEYLQTVRAFPIRMKVSIVVKYYSVVLHSSK